MLDTSGVLAELADALDVEGLPEMAWETSTTIYTHLERHRDHIHYKTYKTRGRLWAVGRWRVPANGSFNNASRGQGCAGVRTDSTICTPQTCLGQWLLRGIVSATDPSLFNHVNAPCKASAFHPARI